jgi:signal transduction histidine kinase
MTSVVRLDIQRSTQHRLLGGVCAGVATRVGIDVGIVRFAALALCVAGGIGVVFYLAAWVLLPSDEATLATTPPGTLPSVTLPQRRGDRVEDAAAVVGVLGLLLVLRALGVWWSDEVAIVGIVAAAGIALATGSPEAERAGSDRSAAVRIAVGFLLVGLGVVAFGALTGDVTAMFGSFFGAALAAGGLALIAAPWLRSLSRDLAAERRARMRSQQRAEIAAHLHDGVLQTLTLIQRRANDPREVTTLARRQERQLRDWLHGVETMPDTTTIAAAFRRASDEVEDRYGVRIELVCVGDGLRDEHAGVLIAAATEAMTNAAQHAGVDVIDVYAEVTASTLSAFVRDRGRGFDTDAVPDDRHGIANSIMGRMQRVGGSARIRSTIDGGTEVALEVSR